MDLHEAQSIASRYIAHIIASPDERKTFETYATSDDYHAPMAQHMQRLLGLATPPSKDDLAKIREAGDALFQPFAAALDQHASGQFEMYQPANVCVVTKKTT
ncbi:hypothetical protein EPN29_13875 [bacterium]|nr:MAG: hypothetical protein EPN29_13875 [bacterium]